MTLTKHELIHLLDMVDSMSRDMATKLAMLIAANGVNTMLSDTANEWLGEGE